MVGFYLDIPEGFWKYRERHKPLAGSELWRLTKEKLCKQP